MTKKKGTNMRVTPEFNDFIQELSLQRAIRGITKRPSSRDTTKKILMNQELRRLIEKEMLSEKINMRKLLKYE